MNLNWNTLLRSLGLTVVIYIGINFVTLLFTLLRYGTTGSVAWTNGTFYFNETPVGLVWGSREATLFLLLTFAWMLLRAYRRGALTKSPTD